jgi:hypothetical protein
MAKKSARESFGSGIMSAGGWTIAGCLALLVYQAFMWLRNGAWPEIPFSIFWHWLGWSFPQTQWQGILKILAWIFDQPTSAVLGVAGMCLVFLGSLMSGHAESY